jgi:hypothetical protein
MRILVALIVAVVLAAGAGFGWHRRPGSGPVVRVDNRFEFTVRAPYATVAPLFGAWAERAWAGGWEPHFLFPAPAQDQEGMVFQVAHGGHTGTWVNTMFDLAQGKVQYVYLVPGVQVAVIDIELSRQGETATTARVRYRRTALAPRHNARILAQGRSDAANGPHWAAEIEAGLRRFRCDPTRS